MIARVHRWAGLTICLALAAPVRAEAPAESEGFHGGLSAGLGLAYNLLGIRGEMGSNHLGVFAGIGFLGRTQGSTLTASEPTSFSAGARWYSGVRQGVFVSLNLNWTWWSEYYSVDDRFSPNPRIFPGRLFTATATAGYRWRFRAFFLEAGLGGGLYRQQEPLSDLSANPNPAGPQPAPTTGAIPDVTLGLGFDL
ncbi:MAG TPA: hypothetical protein VFE90_05030 [Myxococcales bacterium]|nr:hypothetical protein [Myxococcales bacterium]